MLDRLRALKRWLFPALLLVVALVTAISLLGKMRRDVWTYYTDGEGLRTDANGEKARPVLWQDPEPQYLEEKTEPAGGTLEAAFSADGTTMVLVRWEESADMYVSRWDGRVWSPPAPLKSVNTAANERSPALSRDGRFLYFSSDRKGGLGGYDLFAATWNGNKWSGAKGLPSSVNTGANELGAALSADESQLYFSSDRDGEGDDIFVSAIGESGKKKKNLPEFAEAAPVDDLNSKASDVQAALTSRGDHFFLASDRDRDRDAGFKLYISRVVDGEPLPPEEIDLYIKRGDVTDPAVRMDGFDLLFSSGEAESEAGYQLYRSTTREVVGYTDMSRWGDFKSLMADIAWWIVLAAAALIALIYILEKWRDMTTLFHKCLAGSAVVHLLALLIAMWWLIVQEIDKKEIARQEVEISIDALAEEELAMESVPQETELTEAMTNVESEKVEAEFGAPGFEEKNDAQAMPEAAKLVKESQLVEAQPAMSEARPDQPVLEPSATRSLLNDLAETTLPEVDAPVLEESDPTRPTEVADTSEETFEPEVMATETAKTEVAEVADAAVEAAVASTEVTEIYEPMPLADALKESVVEVTMQEVPVEALEQSEPLESSVLSELEVAEFVDPAEMSLDEGQSQSGEAPADTSADEFSPQGAVANLSSAPAEGEAVADSAMASAADASAVGAGETGSNDSAIGEVAANIGSASAADESLPEAAMDGGALSGLPDLTLTDPGAPMLEEPDAAQAGAPANTSDDMFKPSDSAPTLSTAPAKSDSVADSALATRADIAAVTGGALVAGSPVIESRPNELTSSTRAESMPPVGAPAAEIGSLPEVAMVDLGAPKLEEGAAAAAGAPANTSDDMFKPGGGAPQLATAKAAAARVADAAKSDASDATAVSGGGLVASSAVSETRPPTRSGTVGIENMPPTKSIEAGLPESAMVDAGAPKLEEGAVGGGKPADTSKAIFNPGDAASKLATAPAGGRSVADAAVNDTAGSAIAAATSAKTGGVEISPTRLESSGPLPDLGGGVASAERATAAPMGSLLPTDLEIDPNLDSKGMAVAIQKQRGKPGIETIKQMGGSDGTERAISAAIEWLMKNQEPDGRWDTRKHGAKHDYDSGGTGLVLLCLYGWGERHDKPCKYQQNARRAIDWLLEEQREDGYLGEAPGMMYSHAIASIALCEAYGLTKDKRLREPAERAIAYTLAAQSKRRGGWRYSPGEDSDTSVTGWQFMALHSARMAGLEVPEEAFERARKFLSSMGGGKHGGLYGYQKRGDLSRAMVATGMFCRQLDLVPPSHPQMQESARVLKMHKMKSDRPDLYYVYYATLALYQHQGPIWQDWNERLKEILQQIQAKNGSWDPSSSMTGDGGRVVSTTLATLSLEVYYRLLPMYGFRNDEVDAPEAKKKAE